ncbi:PAS domain-containing sensor histidine kinase [Methylocapsa aurea]|uniref:PAS domain-containing sensor histidine kinase n=1 Tax=Methylocapsa aurea TaxID=663610 RepID=UPI00138DD71D|nr:PAS domain-containing sensor histidine kinase [Methylocapsa aurea]
MGYSLSLEGQIANLVHPDALTRPIERARQESFILRRLASSLAAAAAAPLYLALHGAPTLLEALVFVWLIAPLGAIAFLSATGRLLAAEAISTFALIAAGLTAACGAGAADQTALAWLVLAPLDSIFTLNAVLVGLSGGFAILAVLALAAADALGFSGAPAGMASAAFFVAPALAYATAAAIGFVRLQVRRSSAEQLQAERFRVLIETVGELVVTHDRSGAVTSLSRNCQSLFGLPPGELMGRGFFEHVHVADRPAFLKAIADASHGAAPVHTTLRLRTSALVDRGAYAEPVFLWLDMRASRWSEDANAQRRGRPGEGAIAIFRDVTKAKLRQDELEAARASAEDASLSKDHFLANMSHELRTPLNSIIGFSEILSDAQLAPSDPAKQREYAAIIHQSGQHLLAVVNSILDLSKIRSGSFDLLPEPFSIGPLIDRCCEMVQLEAKEAGVELQRAYPEGLEDIIGDKRAFKQILINLLSNAVKFTPAKGSVSIGARLEGNSLLILVADTGIGINARDLARLGDPFFQVKASLDRPFEGTGLGLSIVSGLVGLQGGAIALASEPDKGTCVLVRLPVDCRRSIDKMRASVKIETIPRYCRGEDERDLFQQMMVKKIA